MRCPTLKDLPPPPPGKTGWPWTEESPQLPDTMPDGRPWPKISIVTPNYNYGRFLEETIRSVLLQGYPNLEYIIIDGGSTDNSVEIIKKYEPWLAYWVSEPDRGQSDAINKGFKKATGDILGWINSDDLYLPGALRRVALMFAKTGCDILSGNTVYLENGCRSVKKRPTLFSVGKMLRTYRSPAPQPSTFWLRECWDMYGPLDVHLHYRMDWALFLCFAASDLKWVSCDEDLVLFRRHADQKTGSWRNPHFHEERIRAIEWFASYNEFPQKYARDIIRGLFYEGWFISWLAVNIQGNGHISDIFRVITAPIHNWRCLLTPLYYRKTLGVISDVIKKRLYSNTHREG